MTEKEKKFIPLLEKINKYKQETNVTYENMPVLNIISKIRFDVVDCLKELDKCAFGIPVDNRSYLVVKLSDVKEILGDVK